MSKGWLGTVALLFASATWAQDPTQVDSKHYKVLLENDQVRVLRITFGPHEKSVMHSHPGAVAVFLTDLHVNHTMADGKTVEAHQKPGDATWHEAMSHLPENLGDKPIELVLVEVKSRGSK